MQRIYHIAPTAKPWSADSRSISVGEKQLVEDLDHARDQLLSSPRRPSES